MREGRMETVWGEFWVQTFKTASIGIEVENPQTQKTMDYIYKV